VNDDVAVSARGGRRPADRIAIALAIGILVAILAVYFQRGFFPGDAFNYLAAGERLNAGHLLYAISPGDRPIGLEPPYWNVPLLSPPPVAVLFRPLAALPSDIGAYLWWAASEMATLLAVGLMMRRRPILVSAAVVIFSIPLTYEIGVGNLNGLVLLGLVVTWRATTRSEERTTGILSGVLAAFKLTPLLLIWWLLTATRWRAVGWAVATGLAILVVSVLGAGIDAHLTYLGVIRDTGAAGARPLSLAGMATYLGVAPEIAKLLPSIALIVGVGLVALLRKRPDLAFVVTVVTMVFGSPTISINWFIYLLACLAPVVWPLSPSGLDLDQRVTAARIVPSSSS
jgi:alpha-1,2-mannosyltransferase